MKFLIGIIWLSAFALMFACVASYADDPNHGLPLVQAAAPKHGFVCVPAITPRLGPVRSKELT